MLKISIIRATLCEREGEAEGFAVQFWLGRMIFQITFARFPRSK